MSGLFAMLLRDMLTVRRLAVVAALLPAVACSAPEDTDPSTTAGGGHAGGLGGGGSGGAGSGVGGSVGGPSCAELPSHCGATQSQSCCRSQTLPGGSFLRSYDGVTFTDASNPATVSSFSLDVYEVTVGRFRAFVDAGMGTQSTAPSANAGAHPLIPGSGWSELWNDYLPAITSALRQALACNASWQTWTDTPDAADPARETLPINCTTWFEAFAFCVWDGGRLPTEAEWNYAAAGGDEQREYPWGSSLDASHAAYDCLGDGLSGCAIEDILQVGSRSPLGDGRWGQADLAGNMSEWVRDWMDLYANPCVDCANLTPTANHARRGGSWGGSATGLLSSQRGFVLAAHRESDVGFRCAREP